MNHAVSRLGHYVSAVVLAVSPFVSRAQNTASVHMPSPATAGWIAAGTFLAPIVGAIGLDVGVPPAIIVATTLLAPMAGYAYGGIPKRALAPLRRRLLVLGVAAAIVGGLCAGDSCAVLGPSSLNSDVAALVGVAGASTFVVMTVNDLRNVPRAVRENNNSLFAAREINQRNEKRVVLRPAWIRSSRMLGVQAKVGF